LESLLAIPQAHVHFYGKSEKPARKVGHVTVRADSEARREQRIAEVLQLIHDKQIQETSVMKLLPNLFENNRKWAESIKKIHPDFFQKLSEQQSPEYLWIGCSDSRVPANEIVGLMPGEIFVHRNVANMVVHTDVNCLSVLQYAVDVLKVKHIMVVGHYGCGGVRAAMGNQKLGLIDNWLRNIKDIYRQHREKLEAIADEESARQPVIVN
jgi:carbonic anhydrase